MKFSPLPAAEFAVVCIIVPGLIIVNGWAPYMFAFLWAATGYGLLVLRVLHYDALRDIWKWRAVTRAALKPIVIRWAVACVLMLVLIYLYDPGRAFGLLQERPQFLPVLMLLYPVLSALPQELVFCSYFFTRFKPLFGADRFMVCMSAITFAYAHCLYLNPIAPALSFIGGLIFATTYRKSGSLALVTIEHALYGNALFVIGLGWYFYSGGVDISQAALLSGQ